MTCQGLGLGLHVLHYLPLYVERYITMSCTELFKPCSSIKGLTVPSCEAMQVSVASRNIVDVRMAWLDALSGAPEVSSSEYQVGAYIRFNKGPNMSCRWS